MDSASFYDDFMEYQLQSGINDRIYGLYKRVRRIGIRRNSKILELGCGVGMLTYLLSRHIKDGLIEAMDISPRSIDFAKNQLPGSQIILSASNIENYKAARPPFDLVLLFDVLEHISIDLHEQIFQKLAGWMQERSLMLINLPNPGYILYDRKNNPSALQEIDQPVYLPELAASLSAASMEVLSMETYSVWARNDYQFLVVRKKTEFKEEILSRKMSIFQKGARWLKRKWRKMLYRYPRKSRSHSG